MLDIIMLKKRLLQVGITTVAAAQGILGLGHVRVAAAEEAGEEIDYMGNAAWIEAAANTIVAGTTDPTSTPTPSSYDPYTLTDEEAIEMGTYIYENYVKKYIENDETLFNYYKRYSELEDIINYVCIINQKYPVLYRYRASECTGGDLYMYVSFCELINNANFYEIGNYEKTDLFPFSIFIKKGRPEQKMLEEMENEFSHLLNDKVTNEEIYEYWGKTIKMMINYKETLKDWHSFDAILLYYTLYDQVGCFDVKKEKFNYLKHNSIPASYVFDNRSGNLDLYDAIYYISSTTKQEYANLTDEEYNLYRGCFNKAAEWFDQENVTKDNYIKRIDNSH